MKKKIAVLLCAAMSIGMMAGCNGTENKGDSTQSETGDASEKTEVSIWHDGDEAIMKVIEDQVMRN